MTKKFYESKTFWVNVVVIAAGLFAGLYESLASGAVLTVIGVANILLRAVTDKRIEWKFE